MCLEGLIYEENFHYFYHTFLKQTIQKNKIKAEASEILRNTPYSKESGARLWGCAEDPNHVVVSSDWIDASW